MVTDEEGLMMPVPGFTMKMAWLVVFSLKALYEGSAYHVDLFAVRDGQLGGDSVSFFSAVEFDEVLNMHRWVKADPFHFIVQVAN